MPPEITALYSIPLAVIMVGLSAHVTMLRAKAGISIMDGGNAHLAERIRRHGNFVENVPFALLLMLIGELLGTSSGWLHAIGILLVVSRIVHPFGIKHDQPANPIRIAGSSATTIATLIAAGNILARLLAQ